MIVKRVTAALKRQDWAVVSIEFVLVVVGVLLAFQINDWAAERASEDSRQQASERLLEEVERAVAYIRQATRYEEGNVHALREILRPDAARKTSDQRAALTAKLVASRSMVALAPPSSVYDDIVSSGELNRIGDEEVRAAISRFRATLSFEERMRQQLQTTLPSFERIGAFRYAIDPSGRMTMDVDFAALDRDFQARQIIVLTADNRRILLMLRNRALRDAERMCVELGAFVGRTCNLQLPPPSFD